MQVFYTQSSSILSQLAPQASLAARRTVSPICRQTASRQTRSFVSNPFSPGVQTLTATRTVPYPASAVYAVVSDITNYSAFLPFCRSSTVTRQSSADKDGNTWPEEAQLVVGWNNDISETFTSRVYCAPERFVEAVAGTTDTTLDPDLIAHHAPRSSGDVAADPTRDAKVLTHLLTRWSLRPFMFKPGPLKTGQGGSDAASNPPAKEQTEVNLSIEYQFTNPIYAAMSSAAAPKVAGYMIEAFEKRVRDLLDAPTR